MSAVERYSEETLGKVICFWLRHNAVKNAPKVVIDLCVIFGVWEEQDRDWTEVLHALRDKGDAAQHRIWPALSQSPTRFVTVVSL